MATEVCEFFAEIAMAPSLKGKTIVLLELHCTVNKCISYRYKKITLLITPGFRLF